MMFAKHLLRAVPNFCSYQVGLAWQTEDTIVSSNSLENLHFLSPANAPYLYKKIISLIWEGIHLAKIISIIPYTLIIFPFSKVPKGTVIKTENGSFLASLDKEGDIFIAARGGAGGKGNHFFLSNENRAPAVAEVGAEGQVRVVKIELKTMAHFGLVSNKSENQK